MSQKLQVYGFKRVEDLSKVNRDFIKNYDKNCGKGYFLKVDVEYPKYLYSDLPFLTERKKIGECNKLVSTVQDKVNYVDHIIVLK